MSNLRYSPSDSPLHRICAMAHTVPMTRELATPTPNDDLGATWARVFTYYRSQGYSRADSEHLADAAVILKTGPC